MIFKFKGLFSPNHIIFIELWFYSTSGFCDGGKNKGLILPTRQIGM